MCVGRGTEVGAEPRPGLVGEGVESDAWNLPSYAMQR